MTKSNVKILFLATIAVFAFSCKKKEIAPTGITLTPPSLMTYVGATDTLKIALTPPNASGAITWSSSDLSIASVSRSGVVTGVAAGTAVITATTGDNVTATCGVTVNKWTTYTPANSELTSGDIYTIVIDKQGNKWLGTNMGVAKFDGTSWTTYNTANSGLLQDEVFTIAIDAQGNKWFGTKGGVSEFDGTTWTNYTSANSGLIYDWIFSIAVDAQGNKWIGTLFGLSEFNGSTWNNYNPATYGSNNNFIVNKIYTDDRGNEWFGVNLGGMIWKFDGTTWTIYTIEEYMFAGNSILAITADGQANMWFGFGIDGAGVSEFDGAHWTNLNFARGSIDALGLGVQSIAIDAQNNKWFGTIGGGVSSFDGTNWITYDTANSGLVNNYVNAIAIDGQGNKWFGTENGLSELYAQ